MAGTGAMSMMGWGTSTLVLVESNARPEEEEEEVTGGHVYDGMGISTLVFVRPNAQTCIKLEHFHNVERVFTVPRHF